MKHVRAKFAPSSRHVAKVARVRFRASATPLIGLARGANSPPLAVVTTILCQPKHFGVECATATGWPVLPRSARDLISTLPIRPVHGFGCMTCWFVLQPKYSTVCQEPFSERYRGGLLQ